MENNENETTLEVDNINNNENNFVHLHVHSDYSLLDGSVSVKSLAKKAKQLGMPALALTDHGNMLGSLYFQQACKKEGIKAIIGCEVYIAPKSRFDRTDVATGDDTAVDADKSAKKRNYFHMVLLATSEVGYRNLLILTSAGYTEGYYYKPRIDDELLQKHHEGLIALSACLAGEISHWLVNKKYELAKERALFYSNLFGPDHYYLEVQDHNFDEDVMVKKGMVQLAEETGIGLVATNDVHYLNKEDENDNDIFICIGTQSKKSESKRMHATPNCYFKTAEEMEALFKEMPQALSNTLKIAQMCNFEIAQPGPKLPDYQVPEGYEPESYFTMLVEKGLEDRYSPVTLDIKNRAKFEMDTIVQMGFVGYFLIVWDFIDWAKKNGISVGPGRGSGAGSIVAYALKITDIDPLKYNLLFERFLNPERVTMPDFDIDFNDERRDEVVEYVTQKYGADNVAGITTYSTLQTKAVLKDVARVLDIPYAESLQITKEVSHEAKNVADAVEKSVVLQDFKKKGGIYAELFEVAGRLEGLTRGIGVHACGKVIGKSRVVDYVPLMVDSKTKAINTAFESKLIEDCGLVKMDFLGLITLSIIDRCVNLIKQKEPNFNIETISEDDSLTFKLFGEGRTDTIFQFESDGMKKILTDSKPSSIEDLTALNALYRPGPMQFIPEFIKGKKKPKEVKYFHSSLEPILKPTYGVIVYQEQVMQVAQTYAGYSLGGADILRRAMGKKKKEEMDKQQTVFIEGAVKNGHKETEAKALFEILLPFAGYGFNKSHAAAYSVLAYKTAYLKAHYPAEFMAANLTKVSNHPSSLNKYLDESRSMGIEILPPDINHSLSDFSVADGKIYYGFMALKGIGDAVVKEIIETRNTKGHFKGFIDFLEKCPLVSTNKRSIEVLIMAGTFDRVEKEHSRGELIANAEAATDWHLKIKQDEQGGPGLFDMANDEAAGSQPYTFMEADDLTPQEKLEQEKQIVGFYISGHPLDSLKPLWKQEVNLNLSNTEETNARQQYTIMGLISAIQLRTTKKGDQMLTASLEDFNGFIDIVVFSKVLEEGDNRALFEENQPLLLKGKVDNSRGDKAQFKVEQIMQPENIRVREDKTQLVEEHELHLYLSNEVNHQGLNQLKATLVTGDIPLFLHITKSDGEQTTIKAGKDYCVKATPNLLQSLETLPAIEKADLRVL